MSLLKVYRVQLYRRKSGPFECVITARNRKQAQTKAVLKSTVAYRETLAKLERLLAPLPPSHTPQSKFSPTGVLLDGIVKTPPAYPKALTAGAKIVKPKKITQGENTLIDIQIVCLGKAV